MATYEQAGVTLSDDFNHGDLPPTHKTAIEYGYYDGVHMAAKYATIGLLALGALAVMPKGILRKLKGVLQ